MKSASRVPPECGFNLFQRFALGFREESGGEDEVEDAHGSKQPKCPSASQQSLGEAKIKAVLVV